MIWSVSVSKQISLLNGINKHVLALGLKRKSNTFLSEGLFLVSFLLSYIFNAWHSHHVFNCPSSLTLFYIPFINVLFSSPNSANYNKLRIQPPRSDTIFIKLAKLSFTLAFTEKLKLDNIIQVNFLGKWKLQTLLMDKKLLSCGDPALFISHFTGVLKKGKIILVFLKISLWSTEDGPKIGLKQQFQISPDGSTKQNLFQAPDLENI